MATQKISQIPIVSTVSKDTDQFEITDPTDLTQGPGGTTKQQTTGVARTNILGQRSISVTTPYNVDGVNLADVVYINAAAAVGTIAATATALGAEWVCTFRNNTATPVAINAQVGDTFDGAASPYILAANAGVTFNSDGGVNFVSIADVGAETTTGTVTSVDVDGGTTGLTTSGGPVTSSGTITIGGTLDITAGGTGEVTQQAAINALTDVASATVGEVLKKVGTDAVWAADEAGGDTVQNQEPVTGNIQLTSADLSAPTGNFSFPNRFSYFVANTSTNGARGILPPVLDQGNDRIQIGETVFIRNDGSEVLEVRKNDASTVVGHVNSYMTYQLTLLSDSTPAGIGDWNLTPIDSGSVAVTPSFSTNGSIDNKNIVDGGTILVSASVSGLDISLQAMNIATSPKIGTIFDIYGISRSFTLKDFAGGTLATVGANERVTLTLQLDGAAGQFLVSSVDTKHIHGREISAGTTTTYADNGTVITLTSAAAADSVIISGFSAVNYGLGYNHMFVNESAFKMEFDVISNDTVNGSASNYIVPPGFSALIRVIGQSAWQAVNFASTDSANPLPNFTDKAVLFGDGANIPTEDAKNFTYDVTERTVTIGDKDVLPISVDGATVNSSLNVIAANDDSEVPLVLMRSNPQGGPVLGLFGANGTDLIPQPVDNGFLVGGVAIAAYNNDPVPVNRIWTEVGGLTITVDGTVTADVPTKLELAHTITGGNLSTPLASYADGKVKLKDDVFLTDSATTPPAFTVGGGVLDTQLIVSEENDEHGQIIAMSNAVGNLGGLVGVAGYNGTLSAKTQLVTNDVIGTYLFFGYDKDAISPGGAADFNLNAQISVIVESVTGTGGINAQMQFIQNGFGHTRLNSDGTIEEYTDPSTYAAAVTAGGNCG
jgi:hypothetical protein